MSKPKAKIIDGKALADKILCDVRKKIVEKKLAPSLAVILVGDNPASKIYVKLKQKACQKCGIEFNLYKLPSDSPENDIIKCVNFLNNDPEINGIIIQLPLPKKFNENKIIEKLNPQKDADGFHPKNLSPKALAKDNYPPLAKVIIKLIKETKKNLVDKKILIISNNSVFAEPLIYIINKDIGGKSKKPDCAWASSTEKNLKEKIKQADIIIIAVGKPNFLKVNMIKKDAIIIDVGYNRVNGKSTGDVDFKSCASKASWISPVPGGVGPVTVAMLLSNVVKLCETQS